MLTDDLEGMENPFMIAKPAPTRLLGNEFLSQDLEAEVQNAAKRMEKEQ